MREEIISMNQIDSTLIELKNEMMNIKNAKLNEKKAYETAINELMSMTKPPTPGKSIKLTPKEGLTNPTSRSPGSPVISFIGRAIGPVSKKTLVTDTPLTMERPTPVINETALPSEPAVDLTKITPSPVKKKLSPTKKEFSVSPSPEKTTLQSRR